MVTITSQTSTDSTITAATLEVTGARNAAHALEKALIHLDRTGWTVSIELYETTLNGETYTVTIY